MIHRHLEIDAKTAVKELPLAALQDLLERGDLGDWRPLLQEIEAEPAGELSRKVARLVDIYAMYGTSPLIRAWIERCSHRIDGRAQKSGRKQRRSLSKLRRELGKTQLEVATAMGMSQSDYSKLERRRDVRVSTLCKAAAALGGRLELRFKLPEGSFEVELASDRDQ